MKLNANNNGQKESLNHNTALRTKENSMPIIRQNRVVEYERFDCDVMVLLAVAEVVAEYVASQEVV